MSFGLPVQLTSIVTSCQPALTQKGQIWRNHALPSVFGLILSFREALCLEKVADRWAAQSKRIRNRIVGQALRAQSLPCLVTFLALLAIEDPSSLGRAEHRAQLSDT